jgi:superfamily II DNA or RNA helicase
MNPVIEIDVGVVKSRIITQMDNRLFSQLDNELSYEVLGAEYSEASERGWDGRCHLISKKLHMFGTGLLDHVVHILNYLGYDTKQYDQRPVYKKEVLSIVDSTEYRTYQNEIVDAILKYKRLIIWAVPRSGKTLCIKKFYFQTSSFPSLFICQSLAIAAQTADKFKDLDVGIIGDGEFSIGKHVTIATIQSYKNAIKSKDTSIKITEKPLKEEQYSRMVSYLSEIRSVVVDESHHAGSATYRDLLARVRNAEFFIGLSGTPFRQDNKDLIVEQAIGPIKYQVGYSYLIDRGFLVPPYIYLYKIKRVQVSSDNYMRIYKEAIVENDKRNKIICGIAYNLFSLGESVVIIVKYKHHGRLIQKMLLNSHGIVASILFGKTDTSSPDRDALIAELGKAGQNIVISTIMNEGVDVPALKNVINAAGGESSIDVFQRFRNMTPFLGKTFCRTIDFLDSNRHLCRHGMRRDELYNSEEKFTVIYRTAP